MIFNHDYNWKAIPGANPHKGGKLMKICLVTTFPPSQGGLSEYGLHIANELQRNPFIRLTVLADKVDTSEPELEGFRVERCWSFDDLASTWNVLRAIRKQKPDVVWFNLLFSTFGRNPLKAFAGLLTPVLSRLTGCYTHVTLHHLMDTVNLKDAGVRHPRTYRFAGAIATRMLLMANSVSVLMPGYRNILHEKYGRDNVHLRSHGILSREPEFPDFSRRGNPEHRILAFGKWGTYKRLELMIEAFKRISEALPNARLIVGGGNHPHAAGYVESMKEQCKANPAIEFTGYVHEDQLPDLFQSSSVAVMPYSSSTGCSGVAHVACAYGVPVVCADLEDFRQMSDGEGMAIEFYKPGDAEDLAQCLIRFLGDPLKQEAMAEQNFSAALRMTMPNIVLKYLRHFDLEKRSMALRQVMRLRKLPSWVPSKPLLLRLMTRNWLGWVPRSALHRPPASSSASRRSLNHNGNGRGHLSGAGGSVDSHGVGEGRDGSAGDFASSAVARASGGGHPQAEESAQREDLNSSLAVPFTEKSETYKTEGKQPAGTDWERIAPLRQVYSGVDRGVGNNQGGGGDATTRSNGSGVERTVQVTGNGTATE
jgi:glycosyltransferase involved in cell wall biosynthesis